MGGRGCCFQHCRTNKGRSTYSYGISCFRFPKVEEVRKIWIEKVDRGPSWKPMKDSVICEKHFAIDDMLFLNGLTRKYQWSFVFEAKSSQ
jgi:hypothetical protein